MFFLLKRLHPIFAEKETYLYHKNALPVIAIALGMLIIALNQTTRNHKAINGIASCTFGIYLLHDNDLIRSFIWNEIFNVAEYANSPFLVLHCLGTVMAIFGVGIIVEWVRKHTLEKLWICIYKLVSESIPKGWIEAWR